MKIAIREGDGVVVVQVDSSILQENVPLFRERINALLEDGKCRIIIDMSEANYVSSMGVAVIVHAKNRARELNGDVKLASVNRLIRNLLEITNLTRQIEMYDSVNDAAGAFNV